MPTITEQFLSLPRGRILYDAARLRKPVAELFSRDYWVSRDAVAEVAGGRGSVLFLRAGEHALAGSHEWVMRHYRRGGLIAKFSADAYGWLGERRTRCFAEWRLLAELRSLELPVPAPVAAYYRRSGLLYRADLITERLPPSQTLAQSLVSGALSEQQWRSVGRTIARFHAHGVHHADLNANNILLGADGQANEQTNGQIFVLDFDRGRIEARGAWEGRVLARLRRSLDKLKLQHDQVVFTDTQWRWLEQGATHSG
jgi:3-deoxy-D-manno-octulosonic acid kinase